MEKSCFRPIKRIDRELDFVKKKSMEKMNELLLRTAFACAACDGEIAMEEIALIKKMSEEKHLFGNVNIETVLHSLCDEIKKNGKSFLKNFLKQLKELSFSEDEELQMLQVAVYAIQADERVEYSEIKFF